MYVRIKRAFEFENERGEKVTAPRGWVGELPEKHAKAALSSGHAVEGDPRTVPQAEAGDEPDLDAMTRAELDKLAAERGVDVSKAKTKDDVIAALRAAQA